MELSGLQMNNTEVYNPHVKSYPDYPGMKTPYTSLDYSLGLLLLLCSLIGIPGNTLGVFFFSSITRENSGALLYAVICSVDIVTSFTHLPVAIALFRGRKPGVFNSYLFCALWEVVYTVQQKMSMFLVLLLSTFRTVIIVNPYHNVRIKTVMFSAVMYLIILILIPIVQYTVRPLRGQFKYSWDGAYCYYNFETKFEHIVNLILAGLPPILTFITLLVSIIGLRHSTTKSTAHASQWKYRTSITIVMFTSLFLVCNIPLFINLMHNMTTSLFGVEYPGVYFSTRFMFWYSWHIAKMESVVVNAALNPVLYYFRMDRFRAWCDRFIPCQSCRQGPNMHKRASTQSFETYGTQMVSILMAVPLHKRLDRDDSEEIYDAGAPQDDDRKERTGFPSTAVDKYTVSDA